MEPGLKEDAALRLKVAVGHLESVRKMVDQDVYCVNIMKQLAAVQASLEQVQRILLRNHLLTCVSDAVSQGFGPQIIDELVDAMKYMPFSTGQAIHPAEPLHALVEHPVCQCHRTEPEVT
ncbi:hypothetical protein TPY_3612 [Sulfobacillus acidophilus TPY]|uniref:Copper-sensing transcriptional repressor CsoR n=1 Tax=Sulfobacillus acidophilus (strain ATCC 700253 / DSM 10332 / NAL) TaxID=679936 RepID=G8TVW0_SULAD|nr:hypothetical protein TPY_3612 [Sulfobacillus acidophilus TPY]AEW04804.1 protein of unknown function DUF156 [Sulfobacillus acidophilus DSM 10332]